jgi:hypothetical protein
MQEVHALSWRDCFVVTAFACTAALPRRCLRAAAGMRGRTGFRHWLCAGAALVCLAYLPAHLPALAQAPASPEADNTTVVPRSTSTAKSTSTGGRGQVTMTAYLTMPGKAIAQGLVWRVFRDSPGPASKVQLVSTHKEASPTLRLDAGVYRINVALGRANLTRKITVVGDQATKEEFVLNAGGLRVVPVLTGGEPANDKLVSIDVESDERDDYGQRTKVVSSARAGTVLRLNAGFYSLVSTYGDANAVARADVSVEAGKLSEVTLAHPAARVSFKLVTRRGGDAIADTQWNVMTSQGDAVKESSGALPTHILAPGSYVVRAGHAGRFYKRDFAVKAGDDALVEVIIP